MHERNNSNITKWIIPNSKQKLLILERNFSDNLIYFRLCIFSRISWTAGCHDYVRTALSNGPLYNANYREGKA